MHFPSHVPHNSGEATQLVGPCFLAGGAPRVHHPPLALLDIQFLSFPSRFQALSPSFLESVVESCQGVSPLLLVHSWYSSTGPVF